jgi:hypothetical protein
MKESFEAQDSQEQMTSQKRLENYIKFFDACTQAYAKSTEELGIKLASSGIDFSIEQSVYIFSNLQSINLDELIKSFDLEEYVIEASAWLKNAESVSYTKEDIVSLALNLKFKKMIGDFVHKVLPESEDPSFLHKELKDEEISVYNVLRDTFVQDNPVYENIPHLGIGLKAPEIK